MTTNNPPVEPNINLPGQLQQAAVAPKTPPRTYTIRERVLVLVALGVAVLCDRLLIAPLWQGGQFPFFSGIFWLAFLGAVSVFYRQRLKKSKPLWFVGGLTAVLCCWNLLFDYRSSYGLLTYFVIPCVLMAYTQFLGSGRTIKEAGGIAVDWILGWFIRPFSAIPRLFGAVESMVSGGKKAVLGKVLVGLLITLPLLLVVVPLLVSADMVFQFYLEQVFRDFDLQYVVGHTLVVAVALLLFYSFLWNIGFAEKRKAAALPGEIQVAKFSVQIDLVITCMVLGAVCLVYLLFCSVQFTYLFAGAGLPGHMTYSEYAREGFAQIIAICGLNLALFGVFLQYGKKHRAASGLLAALLGLTAVMLVSGFVRLKLYIDAYGLTWLRLLSAWFILFLAVVIALCAIRMVREKLPLIGVCAIVLLGWYLALGYANPDAFIVRYNLSASGKPTVWAEQNRRYISRLSDDGKLVLLKSGALLREEDVQEWRSREEDQRGYSLSSHRMQDYLN